MDAPDDSDSVENTSDHAGDPDDFIDRRQLAPKLSCSVSQVDNLKDSGVIPYLKIRGMVRYHWPTVRQVLLRDCHQGAPTSTSGQICEHSDLAALLREQARLVCRVEELLKLLELALRDRRSPNVEKSKFSA